MSIQGTGQHGIFEQASEILSNADIKMVSAPIMDISGSFIRQGIKEGKDMSYFLHRLSGI